MTNQADAFYISQVLEGDVEAFRELVSRYNGLIYRIAYSMVGNEEEAKDAVQETFYRAYRSLNSYNPGWPFGAWLRRITVNYLLDQRKKKNVNTVSITTEESNEIDLPDKNYNPREVQGQQEQQQKIMEALKKLPDKYRLILTLRHFENLSYEEISETLSIPLGTVMTNIHRARKKLAEALHPIQSELLS